MKNFVICRTCEENGIYKPLGEVDHNGNFWVKRRLDFTVVAGDSFTVACSTCGQLAYKKERRINEISIERIEWLYWIGTQAGTIQEGLSGNSSSTGTVI